MSALGAPLPASFYARDCVAVAQDLVGRYLVRDEVVLRIAETEAYCGPDDTAAHTRMGRTARNAPMWGPPGRAYVYLCYGLHVMLNVVAGSPLGSAVLIRAAEPVAGLDAIRARRGGKDGPVLLTGPGKVGAALALDVSMSHHPLTEAGGLWIAAGEPPERLRSGPRVGIDYAQAADRAAPWRFALPRSPWVSAPKGLELR
ncbi:MAG: DNA-3-methyladenine glycosylase [Myxococcota bacterium]